MTELVLLSGGIDSTAVAAWRRPRGALVIDYGQLPAAGEVTAARAVASALSLEIGVLRIDCRSIGSGLLAGAPKSAVAPTSDWWPYRNQLLVTVAAGWALPRGYDGIVLGTVKSDGFHADGTRRFYEQMDKILAMQEGGLRVHVPAAEMTSAELVRESGVPFSVLGWTISCHRSSSSCGDCPGCNKHREVLAELGRRE